MTTPMQDPPDAAPQQGAAEELRAELAGLHQARSVINDVAVGQEEVVDQILIALLCGGNVLIESAPGLGKTLLVRTMGRVLGMDFSRIQFTPDLMPADITGTVILEQQRIGMERFQPGPIFAQMVLADEINRATPKTQSALLEAMQEQTVTVAGVRHELPTPFFVLATQNPIEMEGTYLLPEAQIDRFFFKVDMRYPSVDVLDAILERTTGSLATPPEPAVSPDRIVRLQDIARSVPISSYLRRSVATFVRSTQPATGDAGTDEEVERYVLYGVSPRGGQTLVLAAKAHALLAGRFWVAAEDLRAVALPTLRHRLQRNFEGEAADIDIERVALRLLDQALGRPE
jgi:MoxR-like ATPase